MNTRLHAACFICLATALSSARAEAQVHYHDKGNPWSQRANAGPDAEVPGWFYNLGITGIRAQLVAEEPKALLVKYVFPNSPAANEVNVGDLIVGAGGQLFKEPHRNGYGVKVFGGDGPIAELGEALDRSQGKEGKGKLSMTLRRGNETKEVVLPIGQKYGEYSPTFPAKCPKSDRIVAELLEFLAANQKPNGSFGNPVHNTFAPLAMLASGNSKYLPAIERNVRFHASETRPKETRIAGLINWSYMGAAIVLSEYHLATGEKWVLPELQEIYDHLASSQYLDMAQINPKSKETHPHSFP